MVYKAVFTLNWDFPGSSDSEESACSAGDLDSIPGLGRSPGEGKSYPLQYFGLENPMDRGAWQATYSPWGHKQLDTTKRLLFHFHFTERKTHGAALNYFGIQEI